MTKRINRESGRFHLVKMRIGTIFLFAMLVWPDMAVCAEGDTVTLSGSGTLTRQYVEENLGDATEVIISGFSEIEDIEYIQRGYEDFDEKLRGLGACIEKVDSDRELQKFKLKIG